MDPLPPPSNFLTILSIYSKHFLSPVCISAYAVAEGEYKKDPSLDWRFRSFAQSRSDIPSRLCRIDVGTLCIMSFGILDTLSKRIGRKLKRIFNFPRRRTDTKFNYSSYYTYLFSLISLLEYMLCNAG